MSKAAKRKNNQAFGSTQQAPAYKVNHPTPIAAGIAAMLGHRIQPVFSIDETAPQKAANSEKFVDTRTWEDLHQMRDVVGMLIRQHAESIHESVELVKTVGCDHVAEFNAVVNKTNSDLESFMVGYRKIYDRHAHLNGALETPDDVAEWLSIFEDYQAFQAHFEGVMHHTLITFTEFALEAQDRIRKQQDQASAVQDAEYTMVSETEATEGQA